jgi:hypothetical protein
MVTIHTLEVRFEVEGSGDEAAFARLYQKRAQREREQEEDRSTERRLNDEERALGDRPEWPP